MAGGQLGRRGWRWRGQDGAAAAAALLLASLASGRPAALQAAFVPPAPVMAAGALYAASAAPEAPEAAPPQHGIGRESYPVREQTFAPPAALGGPVGAEVRCATPRPGRAAPTAFSVGGQC